MKGKGRCLAEWAKLCGGSCEGRTPSCGLAVLRCGAGLLLLDRPLSGRDNHTAIE